LHVIYTLSPPQGHKGRCIPEVSTQEKKRLYFSGHHNVIRLKNFFNISPLMDHPTLMNLFFS